MRETFDRLKQAAGPGGYSEDATEIAPYLEEWRSRVNGQTRLLLDQPLLQRYRLAAIAAGMTQKHPCHERNLCAYNDVPRGNRLLESVPVIGASRVAVYAYNLGHQCLNEAMTALLVGEEIRSRM